MAGLKNHPGMWLNDAAAAAFNAYEDKYGVIPLNSAGRYEWEQQQLINRYDKGGTYNRPPYLYPPARPAATSPHVVGGGKAVDTSQYEKFKQHCQEFGFVWYGNGDPVHFNFTSWNGSTGTANQTTRDRQTWLNHSRNAGLVVDGVEGPNTKQAYKNYQTFLKGYGYAGAIDGIWGPGTQTAHEKYYLVFNKSAAVPSPGSPSNLRWVGIQMMLKKYYGYAGLVDNIAGPGTLGCFDNFLQQNNYWDGNRWTSAQRWLKSRWGYTGPIDGIFGDGSQDAWERAEHENWKAFQ